MVAPTFIAGSAIENVGAGIARPTNRGYPLRQNLQFLTHSLYTREAIRCGGMRAGQGRPPLQECGDRKWKGER